MELNTENFNDFIERLRFYNKGKGVDDHLTANPLFIVQSLNRISGIDLAYDPEYYWTDSDHETEMNDEEFEQALAEYIADGGEHDEFNPTYDDEVTRDGKTLFQKIGYSETWEYVNSHFTKEAAEAFIKRKSHDYRKLQIYVESQYWCKEFNSIIDGLLDGSIVFKSGT